jgi:hypothetical protein
MRASFPPGYRFKRPPSEPRVKPSMLPPQHHRGLPDFYSLIEPPSFLNENTQYRFLTFSNHLRPGQLSENGLNGDPDKGAIDMFVIGSISKYFKLTLGRALQKKFKIFERTYPHSSGLLRKWKEYLEKIIPVILNARIAETGLGGCAHGAAFYMRHSLIQQFTSGIPEYIQQLTINPQHVLVLSNAKVSPDPLHSAAGLNARSALLHFPSEPSFPQDFLKRLQQVHPYQAIRIEDPWAYFSGAATEWEKAFRAFLGNPLQKDKFTLNYVENFSFSFSLNDDEDWFSTALEELDALQHVNGLREWIIHILTFFKGGSEKDELLRQAMKQARAAMGPVILNLFENGVKAFEYQGRRNQEATSDIVEVINFFDEEEEYADFFNNDNWEGIYYCGEVPAFFKGD